ncbi:MAG: transcriptional regulator [Cyanobacteria bacterium RYN_339]|nr:transcriptional regulator [Cyanobacteria bacterium RYN_339]
MIVWKLDEVLRLKGVKGRELARRMEIGENYLSRVRHEVPDRLSLSLLDGLCRELDCGIGDLLEFRPDKPVAKKRPAHKAPVAQPDEDFGAIVAEALGAALQEEPEAPAPPAPAPREAVVAAAAPEPVAPAAAAPVAPEPVAPAAAAPVAPVLEVIPPAPAAPEVVPPEAPALEVAAPEVAAPESVRRPPEMPTPSFAPIVIRRSEPVAETPVVAPPAAEPVPVAPLEPPTPELAVPQQRWSEEPVPEAHLDAPLDTTTPAAPAELAESAGVVPATVLKGGALGARLSQLKRHRPT